MDSRAQKGPEFTNSSTSEAHATEPGNSDLVRGKPAIIRAYVLPPQAINFRGCTACSTDVGRLVLDTVIRTYWHPRQELLYPPCAARVSSIQTSQVVAHATTSLGNPGLIFLLIWPIQPLIRRLTVTTG